MQNSKLLRADALTRKIGSVSISNLIQNLKASRSRWRYLKINYVKKNWKRIGGCMSISYSEINRINRNSRKFNSRIFIRRGEKGK